MERISDLMVAMTVIEANYKRADSGIFNNANKIGDKMDAIYISDTLVILICREWGYFEVFGLSNEDFETLREFYRSLGAEEEEDITIPGFEEAFEALDKLFAAIK